MTPKIKVMTSGDCDKRTGIVESHADMEPNISSLVDFCYAGI